MWLELWQWQWQLIMAFMVAHLPVLPTPRAALLIAGMGGTEWDVWLFQALANMFACVKIDRFVIIFRVEDT